MYFLFSAKMSIFLVIFLIFKPRCPAISFQARKKSQKARAWHPEYIAW